MNIRRSRTVSPLHSNQSTELVLQMDKKQMTNAIDRARLRDWLFRALLACAILTGIGIPACRYLPVVPLGSTNDSRATAGLASEHWAEPMEVPGLPNLHRVSEGLYRGAQPTAEGIEQLKKLGVKTIVNLRSSESDRKILGDTGLTYKHIPMTAWRPNDPDVVRFLQIVGDANNLPVFVHCRRGADRTGMMVAIYRVAVQGWSKDEAIAEMTQGGFAFNTGWRNLVRYIRDLDVEEIKRQAQPK